MAGVCRCRWFQLLAKALHGSGVAEGRCLAWVLLPRPSSKRLPFSAFVAALRPLRSSLLAFGFGGLRLVAGDGFEIASTRAENPRVISPPPPPALSLK